ISRSRTWLCRRMMRKGNRRETSGTGEALRRVAGKPAPTRSGGDLGRIAGKPALHVVAEIWEDGLQQGFYGGASVEAFAETAGSSLRGRWLVAYRDLSASPHRDLPRETPSGDLRGR